MSHSLEKFVADITATLPKDRPVLIAGPTASGKSGLAMEIARQAGGTIVNADAMQVYSNWRVLTARPSAEDEMSLPHALYGHVPGDRDYSTGQWMREIKPILADLSRPIVVGGTGLYFAALTEGLADIPAIPKTVHAQAAALIGEGEMGWMIEQLDPETRARIDIQNPMRVQRAWEVQKATGRGLAAWQDDTPPPTLELGDCFPILVDADTDWLNARIEKRFDQMLRGGAVMEARNNLPNWDPAWPSAKAIGAPVLIAHLQGRLSLAEAQESSVIATRQYAKRQRTWFRARMSGWNKVRAEALQGH